MNTDSAVPGLNRIQAHSLKLNLPPFKEQKTIAEILSSFDDKIDLLHRQNKTLEDMAQTLFRQWFAEGGDERWETKKLDEIADYLNGIACQKYPPKNEKDRLPVLKIRELKDGFTGKSDWATSKIEKKYIVEIGDVIFSWSGSLELKIWTGQKCVLNQHLFKVTSKHYPKWFFYLWIRYYLDEFKQIAESKATTMGHIKRRDLSNVMAIVPQQKDLVKMDKNMINLFNKIIFNCKGIGMLKKLRDMVLPRLIYGQIILVSDV